MGKTLMGLSIRDEFLFDSMAKNPELWKPLLEAILGMELEEVKTDHNKNILFNPRYHGAQFDVYAKNFAHTHYVIEFHILPEDFEKRTRFYHELIDLHYLYNHKTYLDIPDTYLIFLCDSDPFGGGKFSYHLKSVIEELPMQKFQNGQHTIFLNAKGTEITPLPLKVLEFLLFFASEDPDNFYSNDALIRHLQHEIHMAKYEQDLRTEYLETMQSTNENQYRGRFDAKKEDIILILQNRGFDCKHLWFPHSSECTNEDLSRLFELALQVESIEEFKHTLEELRNPSKKK